jgi:hypothetical protein
MGFSLVGSFFEIGVEMNGEVLEDVEKNRLEPNLILRSSLSRARSISSDGGC